MDLSVLHFLLIGHLFRGGGGLEPDASFPSSHFALNTEPLVSRDGMSYTSLDWGTSHLQRPQADTGELTRDLTSVWSQDLLRRSSHQIHQALST